MSSTPPDPQTYMSDKEHEAFSQHGLAFYNEKLRSRLEPEHNNEYVAIHVDSGDYALGASSGDAMRAMRQRQATGRLVILHIGAEPEWGLASRLFAGQMMAGQQK